ncbi:Aminodeoxychorismate lyase [Saliniradius amylolyticus]|uniref:Aminodeoxychorismate lyase n=1 Tax=Saliniradius amylolyticus TaxID=2183582 RepID=A0A2S2E2Z6_9ALTE|nr:aminodeoxychorismate lyase [Saliniradius amylolyticus]AWL12021.1 Aminodeoxychorismate lyase [Saliniradius amylolyticus]
MAIINGQPDNQIPITDRGFNYGDGVFTTAVVENGQLQHWPLHQQRLAEGLKRLRIPFEHWPSLLDSIKLQAMAHRQAVMKIIITRGSGGRGYTPPKEPQPNWVISVHDFPEKYVSWREQGIELGLSAVKLAKQPLLAGIKHLNRLEQVLVQQELQDKPYADALVCDTDGVMVETAMANLFWCKDDDWFTPELRQAGVAGVMRHRVLAAMHQQGIDCYPVRQMPMMLEQADSAFICNSVMGRVPVVRFQGQDFDRERYEQLEERLNLD